VFHVAIDPGINVTAISHTDTTELKDNHHDTVNAVDADRISDVLSVGYLLKKSISHGTGCRTVAKRITPMMSRTVDPVKVPKPLCITGCDLLDVRVLYNTRTSNLSRCNSLGQCLWLRCQFFYSFICSSFSKSPFLM
jgi:hypothetical protein